MTPICASSAIVLCGCAALSADPLEPLNRDVFALNTDVARAIGGGGETSSAADPIIGSVTNVLTNLHEPMNFANFALQGRACAAGVSLRRFLTNSTLGMGGIFDVAKRLAGLDPYQTDFGETLGHWGVPAGSYVVVPFLGPSNVRGVAGAVVEFIADPIDLEMIRAGWVVASTIKTGAEMAGLAIESAQATGGFLDHEGDAYLRQRDAFQRAQADELAGSACPVALVSSARSPQ